MNEYIHVEVRHENGLYTFEFRDGAGGLAQITLKQDQILAKMLKALADQHRTGIFLAHSDDEDKVREQVEKARQFLSQYGYHVS